MNDQLPLIQALQALKAAMNRVPMLQEVPQATNQPNDLTTAHVQQPIVTTQESHA